MVRKVTDVIVYARLSVSSEESVSIARQIEAGTKYSEARSWNVLATIVDDGLSATKHRPEDRRGWSEVLSYPGTYQAVVIWKIDRLARNTLDFLNADVMLQARGAAVVSVEQPVDMTTAQGRAFATMLAVFAEMESAETSDRAKAARAYLLRVGRVPGGTVPYGYKSVKNPDGAGHILTQDPQTIHYLRGAVERAAQGDSIYSIMKWLDREAAPLPTASQARRKSDGWRYNTVESMLRSPIIAGMTAYNRGNTSKKRGAEILRNENGLPFVNKKLAIITPTARRRLLLKLDGRQSPQSRPRASKGATSPLLSGLVTCGHCDRKMHRGTNQGRPTLSCPGCHQTISTNQLIKHLESRLLSERSQFLRYDVDPVADDHAETMEDIEEAIANVLLKLSRDESDDADLGEQLSELKRLRREARAAGPAQKRYVIREHVVAVDWSRASDDLERRSILDSQIETLRIVRGKTGRYLDPQRVRLTWTPVPSEEDEEDPEADEEANSRMR